MFDRELAYASGIAVYQTPALEIELIMTTATPPPPSQTASATEIPYEAVTLADAFTYLSAAWKRHRLPALLAGAFVVALTAGYILLAPKKYASYAQLYVRLGRESVTLDPTATVGETYAVNATRENEINSALEILSSRGNYDAVINRLSPEVVLEELAFDDRPSPPGDGTSYVLFEPVGAVSKAHQTALTALQKQIGLDAVRRSNIINASCEAGSPELAQQLLSTYLDAAIDRHMRASRAPGSLQFFQDQTVDVDDQYSMLADELATLKSEVGVASLEERRKTLQDQFSKLETSLATTEADLAEASGMASGLASTLTELPETATATTTGNPEDALGAAERQRNLLSIQRSQLVTKYQASHPEILAIDEQLAQADLMLDASESRKQAVKGTNPTYVQVETRLATERARVAGLAEKRDALVLERKKATERLAELNRHESRIANLEERVKVLRTTGADYTKKLEQARIDRALELEQLSNITISQPATYEPKAVSPKRRVAAVVGLALAIAAALATLVVREWNDRRRGLVPVTLG